MGSHPGGGIEEGETYVESALRELREEAGIDIGPGRRRPGQVAANRGRFGIAEPGACSMRWSPSSVLTLLRPTSMGVGADRRDRR